MEALVPGSLPEALELRAAHPEAIPVAGGTDLMVELNFGRLRPPALLDLSGLEELHGWHRRNGSFFVGAGMTFARIVRELPGLTALVEASRTVGSAQIRARATIGGNLATASPAGDSIPVLAAYDGRVTVASTQGTRTIALADFLLGPKRTDLGPDELIVGVEFAAPAGPGAFAKVGPRNAMVIAVAGVCLQLDERSRAVRVALGSVGPTVLRAPEAEAYAAAVVAWDDLAARPTLGELEEFGRLAAAAAAPIDDLRGSAAYRRHVVEHLVPPGARLDDRRSGGSPMRLGFEVNGLRRELDVGPGASLLTVLRDELGLTGAKNACEQGECGSCSVWLDGEVVCACLVPALQLEGRTVSTVESLAADGGLHPLQEAFIEAGAVQCGFCTPGMLVSAADLLERDPSPDDDAIAEALAGNLCRCTGYQKIREAVRLASGAPS